ncbi:MAG: SOS response-associated peptidase [Elusimicrobiota bacterium]
MCGRYTQTAGLKTLRERFGLKEPTRSLGPRYNIAPGQEAAVIVSGRSLELMSWGLAARCMRPTSSRGAQHCAAAAALIINARAETAASRPAFRKAFSSQRCLIPADGFYEWSRAPKLPYRFVARARELFAFAGLWDSRSFVILTTEANPLVRRVHPRMPVILAREAEAEWIDPSTRPERLAALLTPCPENLLEYYPVSERINSPKNDDEGCVERRREQQQLEL